MKVQKGLTVGSAAGDPHFTTMPTLPNAVAHHQAVYPFALETSCAPGFWFDDQYPPERTVIIRWRFVLRWVMFSFIHKFMWTLYCV